MAAMQMHWNPKDPAALAKAKDLTRNDQSLPNPAAAPPPPDLTDIAVQQAQAAQRRRILAQQGIGSTFLTGPMGTSKPGI
jgi:hypothetical protein